MPTSPETSTQTESAAPVITDELLREIDQNPAKIQSLDRKTRKALRERMAKDAEAEETAASEEEKKKEPAPKEPETPEGEPEPKKAAEAPKEEGKKAEAAGLSELEKKRATAQEEAQRLADEINRFEQKIKARKDRETKLKKEWEDFEKAGVKKPQDVFDETHQAKVAEELERWKKKVEQLETRILEREQEEIQEFETTKRHKEEDRVFGEFEALQGQYEELKTKKPLRVLNQEYANWLDALITESGVKEKSPDADIQALRIKAVERYNSDPDFQKAAKAKPPEEMDKLSLLLQLNDRRQKSGGSLRANWLELLDEQGIIADVVQRGRKEAAKEAAQKTVAALKRGQEEITTLSPSEGSQKAGYADSGMTEGSARAFLKAVNEKQLAGVRLTPEEKLRLKQVREFIIGATT